MTRWWTCSLGTMIAALASFAFAADELPKSDPDESFEVEPPILIPNLKRDDSVPGGVSADATKPPVDIEKLEKNLERAKRSAIGAERLFKIGVLAKVEAEQRALRVVRLQADLENARLARAKEEMQAQEDRKAAGATLTDSGETESALARAIQAAHAAAAAREREEIAAAERNVERQQKLLQLGSGRKSEVARAEQKLADLKAGKN